jgi:hypothetical protein
MQLSPEVRTQKNWVIGLDLDGKPKTQKKSKIQTQKIIQKSKKFYNERTKTLNEREPYRTIKLERFSVLNANFLKKNTKKPIKQRKRYSVGAGYT